MIVNNVKHVTCLMSNLNHFSIKLNEKENLNIDFCSSGPLCLCTTLSDVCNDRGFLENRNVQGHNPQNVHQSKNWFPAFHLPIKWKKGFLQVLGAKTKSNQRIVAQVRERY